MRQFILPVLLFFVCCEVGTAQPQITSGGVFNAASAAPDGLANAGIAQGSIFVVSGAGLGAPNSTPWNPLQQTAYPLPTSQGLNGTTIQFQALPGQGPISAQGPVYAIMLYESPTMLAGILPSATGIGTYNVTVTYNGQSSAPSRVHVVTGAFGMFTYTAILGSPGYSWGPGAVVELDAAGNGTPNDFAHPAMPGQTIVVYGTGLGGVAGDESQGPPPNGGIVPGLVQLGISVGGQPGVLTPNAFFAGRLVNSAGVDVIAFQIPQNVQGCFVSLSVVANSVASNTPTIAIDPSGTSCSDSAIGFSAADFQAIHADQMARIGTVTVEGSVDFTGQQQIRLDTAGATFVNLTATQFNTGPSLNVSSGGCIVVPLNTNWSALPAGFSGTPLDAGSAVNLLGPDGPFGINQQSPGPGYAGVNNNFATVDAGSYNLNNGGGGGDVGAFQSDFTIPTWPTWTNAQAVFQSGIPTGSNQNITWTGGDPNSVVEILGEAADPNTGYSVTFVCNAPPGAGQFTVPVNILSWIPTTNTTLGLMSVLNTGKIPFQAPGLEVGYIDYAMGTGTVVQFTRGIGVKE